MLHANCHKKNIKMASVELNESRNLPSVPNHIRITTYNDWPYSRYNEVNGTIVGEGFAFEILKLLLRRYNFTYTIIPPEKNAIIGEKNSGMIDLLNRNEADMAVAFIPTLSEFRNYCDFSVSLDEMDTTFLLKRPPTSSSGSGLLAPFSQTVWIMIFISLMIVGPTIYLIVLLRSKFAKDDKAEKYTFLTCMWFVYGALLKQGTSVSPIGDSTRLVFATWWIFITILTSFYTANLTAFLTLSKFTLALSTLEDLLNHRYEWFMLAGLPVQTLFRFNYPEVQPLVKSNERGYGFAFDQHLSYEAILKYTNKRVFVGDRALAELIILENYKNNTMMGLKEEKRCPYVISEKNALPKRRAFAFAKGWPYQGRINNELIAAVEGGLVKHFKSENLPEARVCPLNLNSKERRLKVSDLFMTFKVVFAGMGVAVIIFILELFSRLMRKCLDSDCFRKCCGSSEIKPSNHSEESWNYSRKGESNFWIRTPPPIYQMNEDVNHKTQSINGRDYYIIKEETGDRRLVPIRAPSAYLFQYIN